MSRETTRSELGQMIGSRRFDVARYYHVTIGRTTGTTETYQNLANNSDAVGTSLRIFHKSWRSLSLGAKLRPFYTSNEERCLTSIIDNLSAWKSYRWEKAISSSFFSPLSLFLVLTWRVHSWIIQILFPPSDGTLPPREHPCLLTDRDLSFHAIEMHVNLSNEFNR